MSSFTFIETYPESRCRHRGPDCRWCHLLMSTDLDTTLSAGLVHREVLLSYTFKMSSVIFTAPSKTFLAAQSWLNLQSSSLTFMYKYTCTQVFQAQLNSETAVLSANWKVRAWATRYTEIVWEKWQTGKFCLQEPVWPLQMHSVKIVSESCTSIPMDFTWEGN